MEETPQEDYGFIDGFVWQAPEYFHREKTSDWFWGLGIITLTFVIISVIYTNYIFAIFLAAAAFTMALFAHKPPRTVTVQVGPRGIVVGNKLYHYSELESFWIRENDLHPKILVKSKKLFMPYIIVPLADDIDILTLRDYLFGYLKEAIHEETPVQRLIEYLGF